VSEDAWGDILEQEYEANLSSEELSGWRERIVYSASKVVRYLFILGLIALAVYICKPVYDDPITHTPPNESYQPYNYHHQVDEAPWPLLVILGPIAALLSIAATTVMILIETWGLIVNIISAPRLAERNKEKTIVKFLEGTISTSPSMIRASWGCLSHIARLRFSDVDGYSSHWRNIFHVESNNIRKRIVIDSINNASETLASYAALTLGHKEILLIDGVVCKVRSRWYILTWRIHDEQTHGCIDRFDRPDIDKLYVAQLVGSLPKFKLLN